MTAVEAKPKDGAVTAPQELRAAAVRLRCGMPGVDAELAQLLAAAMDASAATENAFDLPPADPKGAGGRLLELARLINRRPS